MSETEAYRLNGVFKCFCGTQPCTMGHGQIGNGKKAIIAIFDRYILIAISSTAIQGFFYPNPHRNGKPTPILEPGEQRIATAFEFYVESMTDITLRIPTKERSKVHNRQLLLGRS